MSKPSQKVHLVTVGAELGAEVTIDSKVAAVGDPEGLNVMDMDMDCTAGTVSWISESVPWRERVASAARISSRE